MAGEPFSWCKNDRGVPVDQARTARLLFCPITKKSEFWGFQTLRHAGTPGTDVLGAQRASLIKQLQRQYIRLTFHPPPNPGLKSDICPTANPRTAANAPESTQIQRRVGTREGKAPRRGPSSTNSCPALCTVLRILCDSPCCAYLLDPQHPWLVQLRESGRPGHQTRYH